MSIGVVFLLRMHLVSEVALVLEMPHKTVAIGEHFVAFPAGELRSGRMVKHVQVIKEIFHLVEGGLAL